MEEDVKILKELTEEYNSQHYMDMPLINGKQIQALENLLKGYRELEEKMLELNKEMTDFSDCWVHIDKIKEKIEELVEKNSKEPKGTMRDYLDNEVIKALQELMEDK